MPSLRQILFAFVLLAVSGLWGCGQGAGKPKEWMYVSVSQVWLRDRLAALYNKVATVKAGDRVEVLDHQKRFVKVRTPGGQVGWVEERYLADQSTFDQFQKVTADASRRPSQGSASVRTLTNLHIAPGRDTDHIFQLQAGTKVEVLARATAEKPGAVAMVPVNKKAGGEAAKPEPVMEDFWLVRTVEDPVRAGWILDRMIDLDVPLDVAQYAEGQRIVAYFVLDRVQDGDKQVPQYLLALNEQKNGLPYDFNQVRVFTWNLKRHRYETAYRERKLFGLLPIHAGTEEFGKEGRLPFFSFRVQDESGNKIERKYKMNTPIVRRVLAPGEQPQRPARSREPRPRHRPNHK